MQSIISGYFGITLMFILHHFTFSRIDGAHFTKPVPTKIKNREKKKKNQQGYKVYLVYVYVGEQEKMKEKEPMNS